MDTLPIEKHPTLPVIEALQSEERYCAERWADGTPNGRPHNERSVDEWAAYVRDYADEALHQSVRGDEEAALHTLRKVANLCVNALKQHGAPHRE